MEIVKHDKTLQELGKDIKRHGNQKLVSELRHYASFSDVNVAVDEYGRQHYIIFEGLTPESKVMITYDDTSIAFGSDEFEVIKGNEAIVERLEHDKKNY